MLHGTAWADRQRFELNLNDWHPIDEQQHVVTVVTVVGVDPQLVDDFEAVLAPVLDVDQRVIQRCAVIPFKTVALAQGTGCCENVGGDDQFQQARELGVGEMDTIKCFEVLAEIFLQRITVSNVRPVAVLEVLQLAD